MKKSRFSEEQTIGMKRNLVCQALLRAIALRKLPKAVIHHTDRGSQYCSHDYQNILAKHSFKVSMSGKGCCYDCTPSAIVGQLS